MLANIKAILGSLPLFLGQIFAQATKGVDPKLFELGGSLLSTGVFFGLWRQSESSTKKAWEEVERVRAERDDWKRKYYEVQAHCSNCAGNPERIKQLRNKL